ncbi:hypothetical protein [Staphylococcus phage PT94]
MQFYKLILCAIYLHFTQHNSIIYLIILCATIFNFFRQSHVYDNFYTSFCIFYTLKAPFFCCFNITIHPFQKSENDFNYFCNIPVI